MTLGERRSQVFVFTKPGTEAGEELAEIVKRKENERQRGTNLFWWGVGSSLGEDLIKIGGQVATIPLLFVAHVRQSAPKAQNSNPQRIVRWTKWQPRQSKEIDVPHFAGVTSRWDEKKRLHYALVCSSQKPLVFDSRGRRFDLNLCRTLGRGRVPGTSQVTALVEGDLTDPQHNKGEYHILFEAVLVAPWQAKLTRYI
jgi:hypothetical protein